MKLILYSVLGDEESLRLKELLSTMVPEDNLTIIRSVEDLTTRLRNPRIDPLTLVIIVTSQQELNGLMGISDLLHDTRLFLILPDRNPNTISKGHTLRPRYITYTDSDYTMSAAVLKKMLESSDPFDSVQTAV